MKRSVIKSKNQLSLLDESFSDNVLLSSDKEKGTHKKQSENSFPEEEIDVCSDLERRSESTDESSKKKLVILVDGSSFIYRAFYALPQLTDPNGNPVGAVYGFCSMLISLFDKHKSDLFCVALDAGRNTFRRDIYPEYKSNREETPVDLKSQFPPLIDKKYMIYSIPKKNNSW